MSNTSSSPLELSLYGYWRSSCSWRVRLALAYKNLSYRNLPTNLLKGEHKTSQHLSLNPSASLPVLLIEEPNGKQHIISQSNAILEYLEEQYPQQPLLPKDPYDRAYVRQLVSIIVADVQPLQNLKVLLKVEQLTGKETCKTEWAREVQEWGLSAFESLVKERAGRFCLGDTFTLADCVLIPQIFNARRFGVDLSKYPTLLRIDAQVGKEANLQAAYPDNQPDAANSKN